MKVMKFGGTSLGTPERMKAVAKIIQREEQAVIVLSAISGTTDTLHQITTLWQKEKSISDKVKALQTHYNAFIEALLQQVDLKKKALLFVDHHLSSLNQITRVHYSETAAKTILAIGEKLSTYLFGLLLCEHQISFQHLDALSFMQINADEEPDLPYITKRLTLELDKYTHTQYVLTQGYICRNAKGEVDNLRRGGSDYSATLIGAAIDADNIQIWTDIDGIHNNDPRIVNTTRPVSHLSYREAAELAYFGAKILHPTCVIPAEKKGIPLRLKNTFSPEASGTLISKNGSGKTATALAVKHGITAIRIESDRMLNAYGFLRQIFEVFEKHKTPIDMITTSEVSVSLTIDDKKALPSILGTLKRFGKVTIDDHQSIICIVGDHISVKSNTLSRIIETLQEIPIRMLSHGGSSNNISLLLAYDHHEMALQKLHTALFEEKIQSVSPILN
ncbi:MAG: aspartate kinase [Saprospiraceae bacterium]|nr:aspartate kinase [Saprospiraceae bacterium]